MRRLIVLIVVSAALGAACAGSDDDATNDDPADAVSTEVEVTAADVSGEQRFPDIIGATAEQTNLGWTFDVTVSSPYDSADRYADAWRIVGPEGTVFGIRELAHDHAAEQPFTRTIQGVEIPDDVELVTIEGRDQANGWGGETFELALSRS